MYQGKAQCELLKEIRSQIATQNGIDYATSECGFEGECKGTCPKCEAARFHFDKLANEEFYSFFFCPSSFVLRLLSLVLIVSQC